MTLAVETPHKSPTAGLQGAFPYYDWLPPTRAKRGPVTAIAFDILIELAVPKCDVRRWPSPTRATMPVPEASVHEYRRAEPRQDDVGSAG